MARRETRQDAAETSRETEPQPAYRRLRRTLVAVGALILVVAASACWIARHHQPPRTVVVFVLDAVRRDALGCYGYHLDTTPHIDNLAADGVRFDRAVSPSGWTLPAVASLLTATWPTIHGAMGRGTALTAIRAETPVATELLQEAGYATIGVANAAFVSPLVGIHRGFDVFDHRHTYNRDARDADETVDLAIAQLRRHRAEPGFYFIHLFDAHLDYGAPAEYTDRFTGARNDPPIPITHKAARSLQTGPDGSRPPAVEDIQYVRAAYDAEIAFADAQVGRLIEELKVLGLYDRATIVITADHGEEFWEHGGFEHGHTLYDELVLVPLIVKTPVDTCPGGREVRSQVRLLDVMPTVFDILSLKPPASFKGVSLVPHIRGERDEDLTALSESTLYGPELLALRGPRYAYVLPMDNVAAAEGELFDWRSDPRETTNLAARLPDTAKEHRERLLRLHDANVSIAGDASEPAILDLSPTRIRQLRSLGYVR